MPGEFTMLNYGKIVESIVEECSGRLNDWEEGFINDMFTQTYPFTDPQKEKILKINEKYRKCNR